MCCLVANKAQLGLPDAQWSALGPAHATNGFAVDRCATPATGVVEDISAVAELDDSVLGWLAREGADPEYGARPLRRAIQRFVENPMSKRILGGEFKEGDHVKVILGEDGLEFTAVDRPNSDDEIADRSEPDQTDAGSAKEPEGATAGD